jgi:hypothetical protein
MALTAMAVLAAAIVALFGIATVVGLVVGGS